MNEKEGTIRHLATSFTTFYLDVIRIGHDQNGQLSINRLTREALIKSSDPFWALTWIISLTACTIILVNRDI